LDGGDFLNKNVGIIIVALLTIAVLASLLLGAVEACGFGRWNGMPGYLKDVTITDLGSYTEYVGNLRDASFVIRIPDDWNGMLVVGCHGWIIDSLWNPDTAQFNLDNAVDTAGVGLPLSLIERGFAYAASSYGEKGFQ
jgi:hypothetical protein